jgi:chromosome segregation ATPase
MDPLEPQPPRPVPPAPPRPELIAPVVRAPAATPMMDFFQKRVEALERELTLERERATSASNLLTQQEALKSEVEGHLKGLTDQLRREKAERDGEEAKSHARGRVEALERRLDEMNATFAQLLKEAVSRQTPAPVYSAVEPALGAELTVFRRTIKDVADQVTRWRDEMKDLPNLLPEVRAVAASIPEGEKRFEEQISSRLDSFASKLQGTLSDWERRHDFELRKQDDRLQSLVDERAAMAKMWEAQGHSIRTEFLKERIARETAMTDQIAELAKRLDAVNLGQRDAGAGSASVRDGLDQVLRHLTATPKAKDEVILELEAEKAELLRAMRERHEQLRAVLNERREIEKTMGDSLVTLSGQLEQERARTRASDARTEGAKGDVEAFKNRIADLERSVSERDSRAASLGAERDELTRALVAEAEKVRTAMAERAAADERWHHRVLELQRKVEEETARAGQEASSTSDLRAKVATLSEHMARALQERDGIVARFADWERERQRLLDALKQKDGMVAMLSSAFQGSLKKS